MNRIVRLNNKICKQLQALLFLFFLSFLHACAVTANLPATRFESPESTGKETDKIHAEGHIGYQGRNEVEFTPDFTLSAPTVTNPSIETPNHRLMGQGYVGLLDWLDIGLALPDSRLGIKAQLFGEPRLRADKGNFSLALSGGVAYLKDEDTSTRLFSSTAQYIKLIEWQLDTGMSLGYRFTKDFLLYTGPFILWDKVKIGYRASPTTSGTELKGTIRSMGFNLGAHVTLGKVYVRVEGAGTKTKIGNSNIGRGTYGLAVGVYL